MGFVFEITDKTGRKIHLPDKSWTHITRKHPSMTNFLEEIKETLEKPDKIIDSNIFDEKVKYYYKYYKNVKFRNKYLLVVVKYLNGNGFIISAFFERYIK